MERERKRTLSPIPGVGLEARITRLEYKCKSIEGDMMRGEHNADNTSRNVKWILGIVIPLALLGFVALVQSLARQELLEEETRAASESVSKVEERTQTIEVDVSMIKAEQRSTRKAVERVAEAVDDMRDSQKRVENTISRRRR